MRVLIILRGPPGSGKSEVAKALKESAGKSNYELLDLDQIIEDKFECNMVVALDKEFVIGEMDFGDGHTTEPEMWIRRFREKDYKMLSVILKVCFDTCVKRAIRREKHPLTTTDAINQFNLFYQKYQNIFVHKSNVKEICVINENKNPSEVAKEIIINSFRDS
jgi:shikimate kinase